MARNLELARLIVRLEGDVKGLEADLVRSEKSLGRLTDYVLKNPVAAFGALGAAAIAVGAKVVDMAAKFEQSMAEVGTLVDTTTVDMKKLSDGVLELFRSLPIKTLDELTQGLYNVISAGVPAADAIDYLRTAAEASVGGVTDVNTAVDGLTTATNAFASQGVSAADAADAFFVAVKAGKTTFGELAGSLGNVAGLANSLGVSLDDLLANVAALTTGGLRTSEAMSALKQVLSNVAKPTSDLRKEYPQLAKDFDLAALKSKGLTQFILELSTRLSGNSDAAVKMFGSVEALNAVLSLTAEDGAKVRDITAQMADKAGAASEAFDKMKGTTENASQVIRNNLNATMVDLGDRLLPLVNAGMQSLIGIIDDLTNNGARNLSRAIDQLTKDFDPTRPELYARAIGKVADALRSGKLDPNSLTAEQIGKLNEAMQGYLDKFGKGGTAALAIQVLNGLKDATGKVAPAAAEAAGAVTTLSAAQIAAVAASKSLTDAQKAAILSAKALSAEQKKLVEQAVRELNPALGTQKKVTREITEEEKALAKQREALTEITNALNSESVNLIDNAKRGLAKLREEMILAGGDARAVDGLLKPLQTRLADLEKRKIADPITKAKEASEQLTRELEKNVKPSKDLEAELKKVAENTQGTLDVAVQWPFELIAREVADIALAGIDAAEQFGLIGSSAAKTLTDTILLAEQLRDLSEIKDPFGKGFSQFLQGLPGIISTLSSILGGLFGESPEAAERKRILRENTERLRELTTVTGDLVDAQSPGRVLSGVQSALGTLFSDLDLGDIQGLPTQENIDKFIRAKLLPILNSLGLTFADLEQVAKDLGIEIFTNGQLNLGALQQLFRGLSTADLGAPTTFRGRLRTVDTGLQVGTITSGGEFGALLGAAGDNAITQALSGIDVTTADGRAQGIAALQNLFERLVSGDLSFGDLGDLSRGDFEKLIIRLVGILQSDQAIDPFTIPTGGTNAGGVSFVQSLDDGFADLSTAAQTTNDYLAGILAQLQAYNPVAAPLLPAGLGSATAASVNGTVFTGAITVNVNVNAAPGQSPEAIGSATVDVIERELAIRLDRARDNLGSAVRS